MSVLLLTWNPQEHQIRDWEEARRKLAKKRRYITSWATGNRVGGVSVIDTAFLFRQQSDHGLVRMGKVESGIYERAHWRPDKAKLGQTANYVDVRWLDQLNVGDRVPRDVLEEHLPHVRWRRLQASGVLLNDDDEQLLLEIWDAHARTIRSAGPDATKVVTLDPPWTWDEQLLAFDLYLRRGPVGGDDSEAIELSSLLRRLDIHPQSTRTPNFRDPNAVGWKLAAIHTRQPGYKGRPVQGEMIDSLVWTRSHGSPEATSSKARAIVNGSTAPAVDDEEEIDAVHHEGRVMYRMHRQRERDPNLRKRKLEKVKSERGYLSCDACDDDLSRWYGDIGDRVYECHHLIPLHSSGPTVTTLSDVVLLCPTCHRVAHRMKPWPSLTAIRRLVEIHSIS